MNQPSVSPLVEETIINVPWGKIAGRWWGSKDRKPIICIHGWQDNSATFDTLIPLLLTQQLSFLCIDLPGHGRSSPIPGGLPYYLMWDGVVLLRRIQKLFEWETISIMGHSLGGIIGFYFAAVYPNDVDALISIDVVAPIFEFTGSSRIAQMGELIDKFLYYDNIKHIKDPVDDYDSLLDMMVNGHGGRVTREGCKILMTRGVSQREDGKYIFNRDNRVKVGWLAPTTADFVRNCASRIKCRYLNIKAMPYDIETWPAYKEVCEIIGKRARECKLIFVEGSHHVHLNDPEKISTEIKDFLLFSNYDQFCIV